MMAAYLPTTMAYIGKTPRYLYKDLMGTPCRKLAHRLNQRRHRRQHHFGARRGELPRYCRCPCSRTHSPVRTDHASAHLFCSVLTSPSSW